MLGHMIGFLLPHHCPSRSFLLSLGDKEWGMGRRQDVIASTGTYHVPTYKLRAKTKECIGLIRLSRDTR